MKQVMEAKRENEAVSLISGISYANRICWFDATRRDRKMDVLCPKMRTGHAPCPGIVWVCGGGFYTTDRSVWIPQLVGYARAGYVVASIEYSLTSEYRFPDPLIDCKEAIRYLRAHADAFCLDASRIFIMGESAGGTLASLTGVTNGRPEFEKGDFLEFSSDVAGVVDFYGVTQFPPHPVRHGINVPYWWTTEAFLGAGYGPAEAACASAASYISAKTPPFMILHGTEDQTVDIAQSRSFYEKLTAAGVRAEYLELQGASHGDDAFYQPVVEQKILDFLASV